MEEDIKVLEEYLNYEVTKRKLSGCEILAIENLIARNKELKEENIKYERANDYLQTLNYKYYEDNVTLLRKNGKIDILADNIHFKYIDDVNNYIPKSKVREKIEEYNKMINATYGDITHQGDIRRDNCIEIRNILQELLQEGDKDETKM